MKYITGYVYCDCPTLQTNEESLCLVQAEFDRTEVILACVCDGKAVGASVTKQLKLWLAEKGERLAGSKTVARRLTESFTQECLRLEKEVQEAADRRDGNARLNLAGILIVGQECVLLQNGDGCICLLNRRFQQSHRRFLNIRKKESGWAVARAQMEQQVGILIGGAGFLKGIDDRMLPQCLAVQEIGQDTQIDKRLQALAQERRRQGYAGSCSAVLVERLT